MSRKLAMPLLYAGEKGVDEATTKCQLLRAYRRAVLRFVNARGYKIKKIDPQWLVDQACVDPQVIPSALDLLVPHWPTTDEAESETRHFITSKLRSQGALQEMGQPFDDGALLPIEVVE